MKLGTRHAVDEEDKFMIGAKMDAEREQAIAERN
jgi:hypothetical protein